MGLNPGRSLSLSNKKIQYVSIQKFGASTGMAVF